MEHDIKQFMDTILDEEDELEYTDYRRYFTYDMEIARTIDNKLVTSDLSKKQGSASNGEKQTPYFIILAASLMQCYPKNKCCARLAFIDEAFAALSRERIEQMVKYFEEHDFLEVETPMLHPIMGGANAKPFTQKTVINKLIDKYERSKIYTGDCKVNRNIFLLPTEVFTDYDSDFADVEKVSQFEDELRELDENGLINILYDKNFVVKKILALPEKWDMYYSLLGRVTKKQIIVEQRDYLEDVLCNSEDTIILKFCEEQLKRLHQGKKPSFSLDELKVIVELIKTIIANKTTLLERELSILKFGDSKVFEKCYKSKICSILRKYGNYEERLEGIDANSEAVFCYNLFF